MSKPSGSTPSQTDTTEITGGGIKQRLINGPESLKNLIGRDGIMWRYVQ